MQTDIQFLRGLSLKITRLTHQLRNQAGEGRDKQMAVEHVLTGLSVTRLSSIAVLSTCRRTFKYRRVLIIRKCLAAKVNELTLSLLLN
jgi:hypothetical protein